MHFSQKQFFYTNAYILKKITQLLWNLYRSYLRSIHTKTIGEKKNVPPLKAQFISPINTVKWGKWENSTVFPQSPWNRIIRSTSRDGWQHWLTARKRGSRQPARQSTIKKHLARWLPRIRMIITAACEWKRWLRVGSAWVALAEQPLPSPPPPDPSHHHQPALTPQTSFRCGRA